MTEEEQKNAVAAMFAAVHQARRLVFKGDMPGSDAPLEIFAALDVFDVIVVASHELRYQFMKTIIERGYYVGPQDRPDTPTEWQGARYIFAGMSDLPFRVTYVPKGEPTS